MGGREGFVYNEDVRMDIKRFHLNMNMMGNAEYSEGYDEKDSKASDFSEPLDTRSASEEIYSDNYYSSDKKRKKMLDEDIREEKRWKGDMFDKNNINYHKFPKLSKHIDKSEVKCSVLKGPFGSRCLNNPLKSDTDDVIRDNKLFTDSDSDTNHITIIDCPDENSEKKKVEVDLIEKHADSSKKLKNILVFLDLPKLQNSVENCHRSSLILNVVKKIAWHKSTC